MKSLISKQEFLKVFNAHPFNGWITFFFKYFSAQTKTKDLWVRRILTYSIAIMFFAGFAFTILKSNRIITKDFYHGVVGTVTIIYVVILKFIVLGGFIAVFMKNTNIRRIRKKLGLTKEEYNECVSYYLDETK